MSSFEMELHRLAGRAYEVGVVCGASCALQTQFASLKGQYIDYLNQDPLYTLQTKILPGTNSADLLRSFENLLPAGIAYDQANHQEILTERVWSGYTQGLLETRGLIDSIVKENGYRALGLEWIYADMDFLEGVLLEKGRSPESLASISFSRICSEYTSSNVLQKGDKEKADLMFALSGSRKREKDITRSDCDIVLVCYEMSSWTGGTIQAIPEGDLRETILQQAEQNVSKQSRYINFRSFSLGTLDDCGFSVSQHLRDYLAQMIRADYKNIRKMVQGGSYVHSVTEWIRSLPSESLTGTGQRLRKALEEDRLKGVIASFGSDERHFLYLGPCGSSDLPRAMHDVYSNATPAESDPEAKKVGIETSMFQRTRKDPYLKKLFAGMWKRIAGSGQYGSIKYSDFGDSIPASAFKYEMADYCQTNGPINENELWNLIRRVDPHWNPQEHDVREWAENLQKAHGRLVQRAIETQELIILCGCPGIGKTTAYFTYQQQRKEGSVCIYFSPRLLVNTDFVEKPVKTVEGDFISLATDSKLINGGEHKYRKPAAIFAKGNGEQPAGGGKRYEFVSYREADTIEDIARSAKDNQSTKAKVSFSDRNEGIGKAPAGGTPVLPTVFRMIRELLDSGEKRIFFACSIQSNTLKEKGKGILQECFFQLFGIKDDRDLTPDKIKEAADKTPEVHFFIDEITGDSGGKGTVIDCLQVKKKIERTWKKKGLESPCPLTVKIIIADANIVNAGSVEILLKDRENSESQIAYSRDSDKKPLSVESAKILKRHSALLINANAFPAGKLAFEFKPVISITESQPIPQNIFKEKKRLFEGMLDDIATRVLDHLEEDPGSQVLVIVQESRDYVDYLKHAIKQKSSDTSVFCLHSKIQENQKKSIFEAIPEGEGPVRDHSIKPEKKGDLYDVIVMTSTGTRGIDFPLATRIICVVPTFRTEDNLAEYVQGIYRSRGGLNGTSNTAEKTIEFVVPQIICANTEPSYLYHALNNVAATMMMTRLCIETRITGAADFIGKPRAFIPLPETYLSKRTKDYYTETKGAFDELCKSSRINYEKRELIKNLYERIMSRTIQDISFQGEEQGVTLFSQARQEKIFQEFTKDIRQSFRNLLVNDYVPESCMTLGSLIVQEIESGRGSRRKIDILDEQRKDIKELYGILKSINNYKNETDDQRNAAMLQDILSDILNMSDLDISIFDDSKTANHFYCMLSGGLLYKYFFCGLRDGELRSFDALRTAAKQHFPDIESEYPVSEQSYCNEDPPYLLFTSANGQKNVFKRYSSKYMTTVPELGLFNLLLLEGDENGGK